MDEESTPNLENDEDIIQEIIRLHKEEGMSEEFLIARTPKGDPAIFLSHPYLGIAFNTSDFRKKKLS